MRIHFGPFILDLETRQLMRAGRETHLSPKAFDLLAMLTVARPQVVAKRVLQERLWPDAFVVEANLSNLVGEIRRALGDATRAPKYLRTVHGHGYAFCGDATAHREPDEPRADQPACWLQWGARRYPLSVGRHVIGRDPEVEGQIDQSTVSRRHARIVVSAEGSALEDVASKNGTFRGNERVTGQVALVDGDAIRIGTLLLTFHQRARGGSTVTQTADAPG